LVRRGPNRSMKPESDALALVEGALLDPGLTGAQLHERLEKWGSLGVRRVLAFPSFLSGLDAAAHPSIAFTGAVSFPSGCSTLASKRMELLECERLGASAAIVVLTPGLVLGGEASALEKEMGALLSTAQGLQVRFLVDVAGTPEAPLTLLFRLLKEFRPSHLVTAGGPYGAPCGPGEVSWVRARLARKVQIQACAEVADPSRALAFRKAGADLLLTREPEALAGFAP
jgi:deoxyribose-phosphate aldolase